MAIESGTSSTSGVLERAFLLLELVTGADGPVGVRELARQSNLARSTVARLGSQLVELGMLAKAPDGALLPGPALASLAAGIGGSRNAATRLLPLLDELVDRFGENAAIAVDDGDRVLYVGDLPAEGAVQVVAVGSERHAFHVVAPGMAIMSVWPSGRLDAYLSSPLEQPTAHSVTNADVLRLRLDACRRDGYVWATEELDLEVNGVAVVVDQPSGPALSVGLYGPSFRLSPTVSPNVGPELADMVKRRAADLL